ncbi:uncharacterized protein B0H18DRAFT_981631 [Fomitopsis serialis]|uniref:uncharacterized protein n=1 Tax=Fomitopsis serialis TaxID=139415 RepID=UPI0020076A01|nr:uncharacterized protein B0H18DRAFT_981631 [Neoantrodia serialis]KAH9934394.1 hypothetical protein B0H18DRAFT_981631 [Neoantrodia serialis]
MTAFDTTLGCFFIGIVLSTLFYGCTVAQVIYYARHYREDRWGFKTFVWLLWLLDTLVTILDVALIWDFLISGHANLLKLGTMPNSGVVEYLVVTIVTLTVQIYYTMTIWKLIKSKTYKILITSVVTVISLVSFAFGIENVYEVAHNPAIPAVYTMTVVPATVQPVMACIADIYITVALSWLLQRERTMFSHTDSLINTLTAWAINRGALTAAMQTAQAITYIAADKDVFYWSIFHFAGGKAYVNSVLAILNARHYIRSGGRSHGTDAFSVQEMPMHNVSARKGLAERSWQWPQWSQRSANNGVMLETDVIRHFDK